MKKHAMLILMFLSIVVTLLTTGLGTRALICSGLDPVLSEKKMLYPAQLLRQDAGLDMVKLNEALKRDGSPQIPVSESNFDLAAWFASVNSRWSADRHRENAIGFFVTSGLGLLMCVTCWRGRPRAGETCKAAPVEAEA